MDAALITGGTAIATGVLGYSGARLQHRAEEGRLDLERARLEKDSEEMQAQRLEQAVEGKRALYCEYLRYAEMPWSFCTRHNPVTQSEVDEWWVAYQAVRRQVLMISFEDVVQNVYAVNEQIANVCDALTSALEGESSDEEARERRMRIWHDNYQGVEASLRGLEAAMRTDVAL